MLHIVNEVTEHFLGQDGYLLAFPNFMGLDFFGYRQWYVLTRFSPLNFSRM